MTKYWACLLLVLNFTNFMKNCIGKLVFGEIVLDQECMLKDENFGEFE